MKIEEYVPIKTPQIMQKLNPRTRISTKNLVGDKLPSHDHEENLLKTAVQDKENNALRLGWARGPSTVARTD